MILETKFDTLESKFERIDSEVEFIKKAVLKLIHKIETLERDRKDMWEYISTKRGKNETI